MSLAHSSSRGFQVNSTCRPTGLSAIPYAYATPIRVARWALPFAVALALAAMIAVGADAVPAQRCIGPTAGRRPQKGIGYGDVESV
jgi:hypothetical protein